MNTWIFLPFTRKCCDEVVRIDGSSKIPSKQIEQSLPGDKLDILQPADTKKKKKMLDC